MVKEDNNLQGSCHCGGISYSISGKNFAADYCHCSTCQKITGAPVSAWMDFKVEQLNWHGSSPQEYQSSESIRRGFCPNCGSTLSYRHVDHPEYITLAITSLDNPNVVNPTYHIYTEDQLSWLNIKDDCMRYKKGKS